MFLLKILFWCSHYRIFVQNDGMFKLSMKCKVCVIIANLLLAPYSFFLPKSSFENRLISCIQKIGCIYIKFAQVLSTRSDLLGRDLAQVLSLCQNSALLSEHINLTQIIQRNFSTSPFSDLNPIAIASASIAQVYQATMFDGAQVVVKILKPKIRAKYRQSIDNLKSLITLWRWLNGDVCYKDYEGKEERNLFVRSEGIIAQLEQIMLQELDLRLEAANIDHMGQINTKCLIPKVYWCATCSDLVTMQMMDGLSINQYIMHCKSQTRRARVAKNLVLIFLQQVFKDGLFHADLHHSNVLVNARDEIILLDFGIVSYIEERERLMIAQILCSLIRRDYWQIANIHKEIGYIPSSTNLHLFAQSCRAVVEPILHLPANQISVAQLMADLLRLSQNFNMPTQPQLFLLHKSLFMLEGMARALHPAINLWSIATPWITSWTRSNFVRIKRSGSNSVISQILRELGLV